MAEFAPRDDAKLQKAMDAGDNDRAMEILAATRKKKQQWKCLASARRNSRANEI